MMEYGIEEIIQWGRQCLTSLGYMLKCTAPVNIRSTPWSNLLCFDTTDGYIYLKQTPKLIALEAKIIQVLQEKFCASVPTVLAHNAELNCFLMKDAGRTLREILKQKFDEALLCRAIEQFTSLQCVVADRIDVLTDIGVPDWRLNKLPDLYMEVVAHKDLLLADGLLEHEIREFEALRPMISDLCQKLSSYSIKETIVQPDFNDNNTLIEDVSQKITTIDVGEISIAHPFFSLLNMLQQMRKHHALTESDDKYMQIKDACLENFRIFESRKNLLAAFETAQILWPVYGIVAGYRLMKACGEENLMSFQPGKFSNTLKELMALVK